MNTKRTDQYGRRAFIKSGLALAALGGVRLAGAAPHISTPYRARPAGGARPWRNLGIIPRSDWTWRNPRPELMRPADDFTRLTVHHAGNAVNTSRRHDEVVRELNGILDAHLRNRFGDIAYHFIIDYAGGIWEGRSLCYMGAHVSGFNERNLGIMLQGNFELQRPSPAQVMALRALVRQSQSAWKIPAERIYGHRDLGLTACPGAHLYALLEAIKT